MQRLFASFESNIPNTQVVSPYAPDGGRQVSVRAPTIAFAEVNLGDRSSTAYEDAAATARTLVEEVDVRGLQVELGGENFVGDSQTGSEGIGFLAAMVILLIAFGSVLAMGIPLLTALFGIGTGIALVGLVVNVIDMPSFSSQAVLMIGIGVGIDYALFIVTRYREGLHDGMSAEDATVRAIDTAGRAVILAGTTVIIAVLGLFTIGLAMIRGLATGIALGVLMTMLAAVTLLPAILGFVGLNIDRLGLPFRRRSPSGERSLWYRWSRLIQRRPWPALLVAATLLLSLSLPLFGLRLGFGDAGNRPTEDTTRRAYDLLSSGFGPGFNGPLLLVAETPGGGADTGILTRLSETLNRTRGVAFGTEPIASGTDEAAILQVFPTSSPQDEATTELVTRLRSDVLPKVTAGTGVSVKVGGLTAAGMTASM